MSQNSSSVVARLRAFPWTESETARGRWMYLIGLCYLLVGYLGTNEIAALNPWSRPALPIATVFDKALPFTPWTVIFYVMYYPLLATPLFFAANSIALTRLTLAQAAMNTFAYVIFLVYPTPIDRPPAVPVEGPFHVLLDTLFRADHPYNTFPSLHVAQACLLALFYLRYAANRRPAGSPISFSPSAVAMFHGVSAVLIAASALLIKQHYIADATSGALLAWATAFIFFRKPRVES